VGFLNLVNQGFWVPVREDDGRSGAESTTVRIRLKEEFFECLGDAEFRKAARFVLVKTWFPELEQQGLLAALGISKAGAQSGVERWTPEIGPEAKR
jgi:hypothetical protein